MLNIYNPLTGASVLACAPQLPMETPIMAQGSQRKTSAKQGNTAPKPKQSNKSSSLPYGRLWDAFPPPEAASKPAPLLQA